LDNAVDADAEDVVVVDVAVEEEEVPGNPPMAVGGGLIRLEEVGDVNRLPCVSDEMRR
jgi:hypothetical protein